jgi:hypothetical protein
MRPSGTAVLYWMPTTIVRIERKLQRGPLVRSLPVHDHPATKVMCRRGTATVYQSWTSVFVLKGCLLEQLGLLEFALTKEVITNPLVALQSYSVTLRVNVITSLHLISICRKSHVTSEKGILFNP